MGNINVIPQLNRIHISKRDFEEALEYVESFKKDLPDIFKRALISSAIIAYSRPFCNSKGPQERSFPIIPGGYKKGLSDDQIRVHDYILKLRNKAVAHSDYEFKPTHPSIQNGIVIQCSRHIDILNELSREKLDLQLFISNTKHMIKFAIDKIYELQNKIS